MKDDRRTKYTKKMIHESFIELLKENSIDKISVTKICELADINRATFYRYYNDQYDLLNSLQDDMFDNIKNIVVESKNDIDTLTEVVCKTFYENKNEWVLLIGNNGDSRFIKKIYNFFNRYFGESKKTNESKMRYKFMLYGYSGIFENWIENGMKEEPEVIANYLKKFRHDLIK